MSQILSDRHASYPHRPGRTGPLPALIILGEEKCGNSIEVWSHCWEHAHTPIPTEN